MPGHAYPWDEVDGFGGEMYCTACPALRFMVGVDEAQPAVLEALAKKAQSEEAGGDDDDSDDDDEDDMLGRAYELIPALLAARSSPA